MRLRGRLRRIKREAGQIAGEYSFIVALVVIMSVMAVSALSVVVSGLIEQMSGAL